MKALPVAFALVLFLGGAISDNFSLEYYETVSLSCDAEHYNITNVQDIMKRYWLIPSGELLEEQTKTDHFDFDTNYTLTVYKIDDVDFGYYFCLLVRSDDSIESIRHGVNIDGADFSDLLERYRKNAVIGGIAAGTLFVIVAGFCFVAHFRYHRRDQQNKAVDALEKAIDGYDLKAYDNVGFEEVPKETQSARNGDPPSKGDVENDKL